MSIWNETALSSQSGLTRLHKFAHFWVLVAKSFVRNRCPIRASSLAYATLLALIPMLAVILSITSTFLKQEGEDRIDQFIVKLVASVTPPATVSTNLDAAVSDPQDAVETNTVPNPELPVTSISTNPPLAATVQTNEPALPSFAKAEDAIHARRQVASSIHQFIQNTRSGALGVTGSLLLIFVGISMLSRIEETFNDIWGVTQGRSWGRRVVLYWSVITLAPMLLVVALALASGPHLEWTRRLLQTMPFISNLLFQLLPIVVLCLTFSAIYGLMPNIKVRWDAALIGGLVGGLLFHVNNSMSVLYVSRVVSYSKIYGSLGLVPVFMMGLYFSWVILLFGAQVSYAFQNRTVYLEERQSDNINQRGREFVALRLMTFIGQAFVRGEPPPSAVRMGRSLAVPTRLIQQIMRTLCSARLVVETSGGDVAYFPARPLETITCHDVLLAMRATHGQELATRDEGTRAEVFGEFQRIQEAERQAANSVTLLALVHRAQAQAQSLPGEGLKALT